MIRVPFHERSPGQQGLWEVSLPMTGGWKGMGFDVSSDPLHSVIQCFCTYSGQLRGWRRLPWCGLLTTPGSRACWPKPWGRWHPAGSPVGGWVYLPGCQWELLTLCRKQPWNSKQSHPQTDSTGQPSGRHWFHHGEGQTIQCKTPPGQHCRKLTLWRLTNLIKVNKTCHIMQILTPSVSGNVCLPFSLYPQSPNFISFSNFIPINSHTLFSQHLHPSHTCRWFQNLLAVHNK